MKDKDSLSGRVKALTSDKSSLTSALDKKITELAVHQKEMDRLNSELKDRETRLKQTQQRLQSTIDAHDEAKEQLINLTNVLDILKKELELSKHNELTSVEESDKNSLTQSASVESGVEVDHASVNELLKGELDSVKDQRRKAEESVCELRKLLDQMKERESEHQETKSRLTEATESLLNVRQENQRLTRRVEELSSVSHELQQEVELHRQKEAEMLDLSERWREKADNYLSQRDQLERECQVWSDRVQALDDKLASMLQTQADLSSRHEGEVSLLKQRIQKLEEELNQSQSLAQQLETRVDEIENDKRIIGKRQANVVKELNREILLLRKKLAQVVDVQPQASTTSLLTVTPLTDGLSATSRTSSSSSIDQIGQSSGPREAVTPAAIDAASSDSQSKSDETTENNGSEAAASLAALPELDKGKLVERILKLQKTLAKRSEKMDFLEDHNHQLVEELKKKTRLIQYYLLREESGALTTAEMDRNKVSGSRCAGVSERVFIACEWSVGVAASVDQQWLRDKECTC